MLYNIRIEFMDGSIEKFQRRSNIKPLNSVKLNDKIADEVYPREWKEIKSEPLY